jgi:hypothetical protein
MKKSYKKLIAIILLCIISIVSIQMANTTYNSSINVDKYVKVISVQYVSNGNYQPMSIMKCVDEKGILYNISDESIKYVGNSVQISTHYSWILTYFGCWIISTFIVLTIGGFIYLIGGLWVISVNSYLY